MSNDVWREQPGQLQGGHVPGISKGLAERMPLLYQRYHRPPKATILPALTCLGLSGLIALAWYWAVGAR